MWSRLTALPNVVERKPHLKGSAQENVEGLQLCLLMVWFCGRFGNISVQHNCLFLCFLPVLLLQFMGGFSSSNMLSKPNIVISCNHESEHEIEDA